MSKPMIRIHNANTDEVIDREMTDQEYQDYLVDLENIQMEKNKIAEKNAQRQLVLNRLGLTEEEAKLLLS
jgi:hypothetical protein